MAHVGDNTYTYMSSKFIVAITIDYITMDCALSTTDSNSDSRDRLRLNKQWNNVLHNT